MKKFKKLVSGALLMCMLGGLAVPLLGRNINGANAIHSDICVLDLEEPRMPDFINITQLLHIKYVIEDQQECIPYDALYLPEITKELERYQKKQLSFGAIPSKKKVVSLDKNVRILAGLKMLKQAFQTTYDHDSTPILEDGDPLYDAIQMIDILLYGDLNQSGLVHFFNQKAIWNEETQMYYTHLVDGKGKDMGEEIDVLLTNMTILNVLGVNTNKPLIEPWILWQTIKQKGGFDSKMRIFASEDPAYEHFTALLDEGYGEAINLLRTLIAEYESIMTVDMTSEWSDLAHFLRIDNNVLNEELFQYDAVDYYDLPWLSLLGKEYNPYILGGSYSDKS